MKKKVTLLTVLLLTLSMLFAPHRLQQLRLHQKGV